MTGIRECNGARSSFAVMVTIVQEKSRPAVEGSRHTDHNPAKAIGVPLRWRMANGWGRVPARVVRDSPAGSERRHS